MNVVFSIRIGLLCVLLTAMGCAPAVVTPLPTHCSPDCGSATLQAWRGRDSWEFWQLSLVSAWR